MRRGDFYRVTNPASRGPKRPAPSRVEGFRVFVIVSRQALIDSKFSTVVCAPVYSALLGLSTEVPVGPDEGLRHESSIHCDGLISLSKAMLTRFVGALPEPRFAELDGALVAALHIDVAGLAG
jgi:mRNA interferase MazF